MFAVHIQRDKIDQIDRQKEMCGESFVMWGKLVVNTIVKKKRLA